MKRSIPFSAILSLFFLPVFSQPFSRMKLNNRNEGISVYQSRNPFYQANVFDFSSILNDSLYNKKIFIPKIPDKQLFFGRIPFSEPNACHCHQKMDNMPILKPVGVYAPMKIYEPDPRDRYTLLITD